MDREGYVPHGDTPPNGFEPVGVRRTPRWVLSLLIVSLLLNVGAIGWIGWVVHDPQYWLPSAYANKGVRGDPGPPGPKGPQGNQGPPGPAGPGVEDVQAQLDDLSTTVDDLSSRIDDLEGQDFQSGIDQVSSDLSDLCTTLEQTQALQNEVLNCP